MLINSREREAIGISLLCVFLVVAVYFKLDRFSLIPGDLGDARLNNYFLENFYRFFSGQSQSLWNLDIFYPYPLTLGFSDNLFGTGFIYSAFRWMSIQSDTSFQLWFLVGYILNFLGAYCALRLLKLPSFPAIVGALIFSFSLLTINHATHAQLHYRFGAALAIAYALKFWEQPSAKSLSATLIWLLYQFYCGVYMGFFTGIFLLAMMVVALLEQPWANRAQVVDFCIKYAKSTWPIIIIFLLGMALLFYPYLQVKSIYGFSRSWADISNQLPRLQSYLIAENIPWWRELRFFFPDVPVRYEHQMFIGISPMLLLIMGIYLGRKSDFRASLLRLSWPSLMLFVFTLSVAGYSLWYLLHKAPLFSAIRALTRWDQVLLFPIAYIAAVGIAVLEKSRRSALRSVAILAVVLIMCEWFIAPYQIKSTKKEWRDRIVAIDKTLPLQIDPDSVLFIAQTRGPFFADELDAMWAASKRNIKTLNGYSGNFPEGFSIEYGIKCFEVEKRLEAYGKFYSKHNLDIAPDTIRKRLLLIGFDGACADKFKN